MFIDQTTDEIESVATFRKTNTDVLVFLLLQTRLAGSVIYTLFAIDADDGSNADITYTLTSPVRAFTLMESAFTKGFSSLYRLVARSLLEPPLE